jgi:hypothetical protein
MKNLLKSLPDTFVRLLVLFVALAAVVIGIRALLPASMTDHAQQVQATVAREMARPIRHAGSTGCGDCHEQAERKKEGYHRNLSCETCHGPAQPHMENPGEVKPTLPRLREFCVRCHAYNPSRPTGFPQINPAAHHPLQPCIGCHDPHDPKPPTTPQECTACHAEIARMKAISPHVFLECTTCHVVPNAHKVTPREVRASIPAERAFCGTCHAKDSATKSSAKVDMVTHGEKYLCWQCHYPHMPEVK